MLAAEPVSVPLESGLPMTAPSQSTNAARLRARTKLFVGGLSYSATDADLTAHFDQFGDIVEAVVICDRTTGRSKGYGFVTYHRAESAAAALKDASPIIAGRKANVNMASGIKRADRTMQYTQRMMGDAGYGVMVDMLGNQILYDPRVAPMPPAHVGQPVYQPVSTPTAHHPQMPAYSPVPWAGLPRATYNPAADMDGAASMHSYFQPMAPTAVYQQTNPYGMAMTAQPMVGPMAAYPRWVPVQYVADQTQSPQLVQVIPPSAASVTTGVSVTAIADLESQMTTLSMGEGQGSPPQPEKSTTEVSSE